jgi:hypothetical protein
MRSSVVAAAVATLATACLAGAATPAGAAVRLDSNSAFVNAHEYVNPTLEVDEDFGGTDFVTFGRTLMPAELQGPEGRSRSTAQLIASVITADDTFPLEPIAGTSLSGRLLNFVRKANNGLSSVPIAYSSGDYEASFEVTTPTRFQFAGAMTVRNTDPSDCTEIAVSLSGPLTRTYTLLGGLGCTTVQGRHRGFIVTDTLPVGSYELEIEYDTSIAAADPGDIREASAALDVSLAFDPPNTRLVSARINSAARRARFTFGKVGTGKGFQCALTRGTAKPRFRKCVSPKVYTGLQKGNYTFQVRVLGAVAPDATPAKRKFRIG